MKSKNVIVFGSSRAKGNTSSVVDFLAPYIDAHVINLHGLDITYYDYQHRNTGDDFLKVIRELIGFDQIVFATPVYWYSMSAQLKTFFDRLSDLIRVEKELGRSLQGKNIYAMSCGSYDEVVQGFEVPFKMSADYMHMEYRGYTHVWKDGEQLDELVKKKLITFSELINSTI